MNIFLSARTVLLLPLFVAGACTGHSEVLTVQGTALWSSPDLMAGFQFEQLTRLSSLDESAPAGLIAGSCAADEATATAVIERTNTSPDEVGLTRLSISSTRDRNAVELTVGETLVELDGDDCAIWEVEPDGDLLTVRIDCDGGDGRLEVEFFFEGCELPPSDSL